MKKILITHAVPEEFIDIQNNEADIQQICTGIGKTKSAYLLTKSIIEKRPELVINMGTAGTIKHKVGDIFVADLFVDRDFEATRLPGVEFEINAKSLLGNAESLRNWFENYENKGICSTGDTFITELSNFKADIVDMEAYSQAFVCQCFNIPFVSVKYITDIIGQNSVKHWEAKLADARESLSDWFYQNQNAFY